MWVAWGLVGGMTFMLGVRKALATAGLDPAALDEVESHLSSEGTRLAWADALQGRSRREGGWSSYVG